VSATYADLYKSPTGPGKGIRKRFLHRTFFGVTVEFFGFLVEKSSEIPYFFRSYAGKPVHFGVTVEIAH
jgi:hypothetical protein